MVITRKKILSPVITKSKFGHNRPGDVFNDKGSIHDLLVSEGWKLEKENEEQEYWCRPERMGGKRNLP